jgi:hypothetical protein
MAAFLQFGSIALDPTKDHSVIDPHATFPQQFFDVTIAQGIPQIPTYRAKKAGSFMTSLRGAGVETGGNVRVQRITTDV